MVTDTAALAAGRGREDGLLSGDSNVISIERDGSVIYPVDGTTIRPNDVVTVLPTEPSEDDVVEAFLAEGDEPPPATW